MNGSEQIHDPKFVLELGKVKLDLTHPVVMAILNVTPDSFWEGSRNRTEVQIIKSLERSVREGAAIIDVGGYSSRPGAPEVTPEEELRRVCVAMEVLKKYHPELPVSVDTFRADVVRETVDRYGPIIVNDISAGELDTGMLDVVADYGLPYIAMHMRGNPGNMQELTEYEDVVSAVTRYFEEKLGELFTRGIEKIILDPGFGFAKTTEQNFRLMKGMEAVCDLGYPVLSGVSRKSMIYKVLGCSPAEALTGTTALNWESLRKGARILRVHDVAAAMDTVRLFEYYERAQ